MGPLDGLLFGLESALTPELLLASLVGALAGTIIGVLPGLGPVAGAALVLPLTFSMSPIVGIVMIAAIYVGSMYGGSTTAVLLNMPGEAASVMTAVDGHAMAQKGRAGAALSIMAIGSFIAGAIGVVLVTLFSPVLAGVGLLFGPAEYLALVAGGLIALARVAGGSAASGFLPMIVGVLLGTIGQEAITSTFRYTMDVPEMALGVDLVPVAIGLFGIAELLLLLENPGRSAKPTRVRFRELLPTRDEWRAAWPAWGRGSVVGFAFGLLPGPSATLSSFASYRLEKSVARNKKALGTGAVEGVAAPEAANNAAAIGGLVPLLSLGLPFSATFALVISAMVVQGIEPGPLLIEDNPEIFWSLIGAMLVANLMLLVLNLPLVGVWVQLLRIPQSLLLPGIVVVAVIGCYSVRNSLLDVYMLGLMAAVGYVMRKLSFDLAPFVLGLVLGPLAEKHLREGLFLSRGDMSYFVSSPIAITLWVLVLLLVVGAGIRTVFTRRRRT
ncbi:tripartite tricarboxylate transporter permease [Pseudonocardia sp. MH-G8]|uniref:tripartite tricarboxylate transporter permease n=1 Tax=Pseudonocardia sp. MH-G8 TaxID=1854588 RepID=UPI000BA09F4F|nr:tripartite tricarboxylate transporter permease [Pseudonocardia sp. MH-G8]OZM76877.1 tripartite tricarboxylate transporter TctA [Pseudonocardia sp. MH-G8]